MNIDLIIQGAQSIKNRGLLPTIKVLFSIIIDLGFDIIYGTDTAGIVKFKIYQNR